MQTLTFSDGHEMPALGLGTWKSKPGVVGDAVRTALEIGYRHFDCAAIYMNESEIGSALAQAMRDGVVKREELWITSKLWNDKHDPADVRPALEQTLADLQLEYLDLYLMHWPVALRKGALIPKTGDDFVPPEELPVEVTWEAIEECKDAGLARHVGVSNFTVPKLEKLHGSARHRPEANQVEMHPYLAQPQLVEWCHAHDVHVTAYSPLGSPDRPESMKTASEPDLLHDPVVASIAERLGGTPGQVLLAWAMARKTSVIPKSVNEGRLRENYAAAELRLDSAAMDSLAALDGTARLILGDVWTIEGSPWTRALLWDE